MQSLTQSLGLRVSQRELRLPLLQERERMRHLHLPLHLHLCDWCST